MENSRKHPEESSGDPDAGRVRPWPAPAEMFAVAEREAAVALIRRGIDEDLCGGDVTTEALVPVETVIRAAVVPRHDGVLCGLPIVAELFRHLEPSISLRPYRDDGDSIRADEPVLELLGQARAILGGERLALNFLQRLAGVASATRRVVDAVRGTGCEIYDTRKTTPGWRVLEKYAVRIGGGRNHRASLAGFALIKDNHRQLLAMSGNCRMADWVRRVRESEPEIPVELEIDSLDELREALDTGVDIVLLDNFSIADLARAVELAGPSPGRPLLEASGGISMANVRAVAETGVDRLALGAITHSAPVLDFGLDRVEVLK